MSRSNDLVSYAEWPIRTEEMRVSVPPGLSTTPVFSFFYQVVRDEAGVCTDFKKQNNTAGGTPL